MHPCRFLVSEASALCCSVFYERPFLLNNWLIFAAKLGECNWLQKLSLSELAQISRRCSDILSLMLSAFQPKHLGAKDSLIVHVKKHIQWTFLPTQFMCTTCKRNDIFLLLKFKDPEINSDYFMFLSMSWVYHTIKPLPPEKTSMSCVLSFKNCGN